MSSSKVPPRVAVLGGQGIGRFHASVLSRLGCEVAAVCCSSIETARQCASDLERDFGITIPPYHRVEEVLALGLDGVSICTPPALHFDHLLACLAQNVPVFCEKPLFWGRNESLDSIRKKLAILRQHPKRRIFVNTSNTHFLDLAVDTLELKTAPRNFKFAFYTQGRNTYGDIACDLFPHALSMTLKLFGKCDLANFRPRVDKHSYTCSFDYGEAKVFFDLKEAADGPKKLSFTLDEQRFDRVQEGMGPTYRVFLENAKTGRIEAEDPFIVFMSAFVDHIGAGAPVTMDSFDIDATNLEMMATLLLPPSVA